MSEVKKSKMGTMEEVPKQRWLEVISKGMGTMGTTWGQPKVIPSIWE